MTPSIATSSRLLKEPYCFSCHCLDPEKLKTCSRCGLAKYCSVECQKGNFFEHKITCKLIYKLGNTVKELAKILKNDPDWGNMFQAHVGKFWSILETRDYMRARFSYASEIYKVGKSAKAFWIVEKSLNEYLDMLRLCHSDNLGIRNIVPFILLELNREEDAYNFIKWWLTIDPDGQYDWGNPPPSIEGEWLYLKNQDIYEDFLKFVEDKHFVELSHLVTIALIKARILEKGKASTLQFRAFKESLEKKDSVLLRCSPVMDKIEGFVTPVTSEMLELQHQLMEDYLDLIMINNKTMLKAVVNPQPLMNQPQPQSITMGDPTEAHSVLLCCQDLFLQSDVIMKEVYKRVGKNPSYKVSSKSFHAM